MPDTLCGGGGALSLILSAYTDETLPTGIASIDRGPVARDPEVGPRPLQQLLHVILQRVRLPLANAFITVRRDTRLSAVIGCDALFDQGQIMVATSSHAIEVLSPRTRWNNSSPLMRRPTTIRSFFCFRSLTMKPRD